MYFVINIDPYNKYPSQWFRLYCWSGVISPIPGNQPYEYIWKRCEANALENDRPQI